MTRFCPCSHTHRHTVHTQILWARMWDTRLLEIWNLLQIAAIIKDLKIMKGMHQAGSIILWPLLQTNKSKMVLFHRSSLSAWTTLMLRMLTAQLLGESWIPSRAGTWRVGPWKLASHGARDCLLILPTCALSWVRSEFLQMQAVLFGAILFSNSCHGGSFHFFQNSKAHQ